MTTITTWVVELLAAVAWLLAEGLVAGGAAEFCRAEILSEGREAIRRRRQFANECRRGIRDLEQHLRVVAA